MEDDRIAQLQELAKTLKIRNASKLLQASKGKVPGATLEAAKAALETQASKQVLAPRYRSTGKSAAEGPNERLQADLIDFSQNTRTKQKYALMVQDVYTREVRAKAIPNKDQATVNEAAKQLIPELVDQKQDYSITTDKGKEFNNLDAAIPEQAGHREKKSMNDISILNRAMQALRRDMAAGVADGDAANWVQALPDAVEAHNSRTHAAVLFMVLPKKLKRMVCRTSASCKIMPENYNLIGTHSCGRKTNCSRQEHSERQRTIKKASSLNLAMFRCWGRGEEMTPQRR